MSARSSFALSLHKFCAFGQSSCCWVFTIDAAQSCQGRRLTQVRGGEGWGVGVGSRGAIEEITSVIDRMVRNSEGHLAGRWLM